MESPLFRGPRSKGLCVTNVNDWLSPWTLKQINPHAGTKDDEQSLVKYFTPLTNSNLIVDRLFGSRYQGECLFVTNATACLA